MPPPDDISQLSETDQFYHIYGKALAAWGEIEYGLSLWFQVCTGLEYNIAQNLFFSGRSFSTRSDLLFSAMETATLDEKWNGFLVEGADKAGGYSGTRNRLAHGVMHPNHVRPDSIEWRIKEPSRWQGKDGYDHLQISTIAANFKTLSTILRMSFLSEFRKEPPSGFFRQLLELPNEADSTELSRKQKERLSQLLSSGS
jgi:hypothetical protein